MDWDNIAHVTAISKALQEKNDMLRQKMEVLEKEKEEVCGEDWNLTSRPLTNKLFQSTRQLNQANSRVEHLEVICLLDVHNT
jgi:hypothetical protein